MDTLRCPVNSQSVVHKKLPTNSTFSFPFLHWNNFGEFKDLKTK